MYIKKEEKTLQQLINTVGKLIYTYIYAYKLFVILVLYKYLLISETELPNMSLKNLRTI